MIYKVNLTEVANEQFRKLNANDFQSIMNELTELSVFPRPTKAEKLKTRPAYRIRVKNFRVLYYIDDSKKAVNILQIKESLINNP